MADLFAKLSNIRMSHEIYGFKHPHTQWEGILALDVWYNLLYREIDAKYPFDDRHLNLNPMQRRRVCVSIPNNYVVMDDNSKLFLIPGGTCNWENGIANGLEWMTDETSSEYVYIWDSNLWKEYYDNSKAISDTRAECTTPRGVLAKVQKVVKELEYKENSYISQRDSETDQDYIWFKQPGNVYSQHLDDQGNPSFADYSQFTKYVNLHLGRAYEVMSGREYWELTDDGKVDDTYTKPIFSEVEGKRELLDKMVKSGFDALVDAFSVVQNEHLFNVYNSNTKMVEEFNPRTANFYSQSQCAIALERVFSRIYKYLQFKSTTGETFQRHVNIDSGYKYLATDSLKNSDHELGYYYDLEQDSQDGVEKHYLRYLNKLRGCLDETDISTNPPVNPYGFTKDEYEVLGQFCEILSKETLGWLGKKWDLCPILQRASERFSTSTRKLMSKGLLSRDTDIMEIE